MKTIKTKSTTINVPETWEDVTWAQWAKLKELDSKEYASPFSKTVAITAHLCNVPEATIALLPTNDLVPIINGVASMLSTKIAPTPRPSFVHNGTTYVFKMEVAAQFMRIEEALNVAELMKANDKPFDPKPYYLAAVFLPEKKPKQKSKGWFSTTSKAIETLNETVEQNFEAIHQAVIGRNTIAELDGYDERVDIIKGLDCITVHALDFFLSILISNSPTATKTQFLSGVLKIKIAQARSTLREIQSLKSQTSYLKSGAARLSMSLAEARLKSLDFMISK